MANQQTCSNPLKKGRATCQLTYAHPFLIIFVRLKNLLLALEILRLHYVSVQAFRRF